MVDLCAVSGGSDLHVRIADRLRCSLLHSHSAQNGERAPPDIGDDGFPGREAYSNAAGTQRHDSKAFAYNRPLAPVAQWIEQPPPKGQVGRSIRLWGATWSVVWLLRRLSQDEGVEFHARLVYRHHGRIRLQLALVEYRVEHLRNEAAVGHGDLVSVAVLPVLFLLREKRFHHLEALGDPVAVPRVHALLVLLVRLGDVFARAQVVERMDLAGDDLREGAHIRAVEGSDGQQLRPGVNLIEVFDDRERLGHKAPAVLERRNQALGVDRFVARFEVLAFGQTHARVLVRQALVVERDAHAERRRGAKESVELHRTAG